MSQFRCLFMMTVFSLSTVAADGQDWCRWRGPAGNSISTETGWSVSALVPAPKIRWVAEVGLGYSAVSVQGNRLYTMGHEDGKDTVFCLSAKDGRELWHYTYPCKPGSYAGPRATPVCDDAQVYTMSREGLLLCFESATGTIRWQKELCNEANGMIPTWGIGTSVILVDDLVVVNVGKCGIALKKDSGKIVWQSPKGKCGYASPVLYGVKENQAMVMFGQKGLYGVEARTGKLLWEKEWLTTNDENSADPIVDGSRVYVSSIYSVGAAVFDMANPTTNLWQNTNLVNKFSTNVLYKGKLYGVHGNTGSRNGREQGMLCCVDFETGRLEWEECIGIASLIMVDEKLIVLNEKGMLFIAKATPDGYKELAKGQVLEKGDDKREAKGKCWTAPTFSHGRLYCRNDRGRIVCIDLTEQGPQ